MSRKKNKTFKTVAFLVILLVIFVWIYAYFNGGDWKISLFDFLKKDGLVWVMGSIFVIIIFIICKRLFRIHF